MFAKPITIGLSPNTQRDDVNLAFRTLLQPWKWQRGTGITGVTDYLEKYFKNNVSFYTFNSGRSALYLLLKAFGISLGDEVIVQAFTCVAVAEPILWLGAIPVYADVNDQLNIDVRSMERAITSKTKAIIVQHTFGIPADMISITKIAQKYKLILIEDCAHSLGAMINGQKTGSLSDAAFFSFGRDKIISCVFGGAATICRRNLLAVATLKKLYAEVRDPSYTWIFQQLLHPLAFACLLPIYNLNIGKIILYLLLKLKLLSKPIIDEEKSGVKPEIYPGRLPNALAILLGNQLHKLDQYNNHRKEIAALYFQALKEDKTVSLPRQSEDAVYLRFNILTDGAKNILTEAKKQKILLGNWYHNVIDPEDVVFEKIKYSRGSCPKAEAFAIKCVNLPTHQGIKKEDAFKIISLLNRI